MTQPEAFKLAQPTDDLQQRLVVEENAIQSRLAMATLPDDVREEIRLLLADAFQRWRNAVG